MQDDDQRASEGTEKMSDEDESASALTGLSPRPIADASGRLPQVVRRVQRLAPEALRYSGSAAARALEGLKSSGSAYAGTRRAFQQIAGRGTPHLDPLVDQALTPQFRHALAAAETSLRRRWPDKWEGTGPGHFMAAISIAREEGVPLVWVPRSGLVLRLLAATDAAARRAVLEDHVAEIVDDCASVVAGVSHPRLREYQDRLAQAVAAHEAGLHAPGQALTAAVITALLQWVYGHKQLKRVRKSPLFAKDAREQLMRDLKAVVLIGAAASAMKGGMDQLPDDQLPDQFNRHATLHRVADRAYTLPTAMSAPSCWLRVCSPRQNSYLRTGACPSRRGRPAPSGGALRAPSLRARSAGRCSSTPPCRFVGAAAESVVFGTLRRIRPGIGPAARYRRLATRPRSHRTPPSSLEAGAREPDIVRFFRLGKYIGRRWAAQGRIS